MIYVRGYSEKWETMIGWLRQAILGRKNDRMRKRDDVWVERKHILESEYANVKHRGLIYRKIPSGIPFSCWKKRKLFFTLCNDCLY